MKNKTKRRTYDIVTIMYMHSQTSLRIEQRSDDVVVIDGTEYTTKFWLNIDGQATTLEGTFNAILNTVTPHIPQDTLILIGCQKPHIARNEYQTYLTNPHEFLSLSSSLSTYLCLYQDRPTILIYLSHE